MFVVDVDVLDADEMDVEWNVSIAFIPFTTLYILTAMNISSSTFEAEEVVCCGTLTAIGVQL